MRAVVVDRWMQPSDLTAREHPEPGPAPGMLRIDVHAAGCNFFDLLMARGTYQVRPPLPFILGAELAGVVRDVGAGVEGFAPGDRVMASLPYGAFAETASVVPALATPIPAGMGFAQAAACPVVYPTSYVALADRARIAPGETLLVTAAAGGVGLAAVQLGKALGARVIALAGGAEKLEVARAAGADLALDYQDAGWVEAVRQATDGRGVDVVVENVGGDVFEGCMKLLAWDARLVVVGFASGRIPEVRLNRVLLKHVSLVGLHFGAMVVQAPAKVAETRRALAALWAGGQARPVVFGEYPLERVAEALHALGGRRSWGKVVLTTGRGS